MRRARLRDRAMAGALATFALSWAPMGCVVIADLGSYAPAPPDAGDGAIDASDSDADAPVDALADARPCSAGCASDEVCGGAGVCVPNCNQHPCETGFVCCPAAAMCASQCVPDCRVTPKVCTDVGHTCDPNVGICAK